MPINTNQLLLPTDIYPSLTVTDILHKCFRDTNAGNKILDFYTKNYNIINITNGTTAGKYGKFFITWDCPAKGGSISGYQEHLNFIRSCYVNSQFTRLLKILMDFKKYNNKHANLLQTNKESRCYGARGTNNSITIDSFIAYYGNKKL